MSIAEFSEIMKNQAYKTWFTNKNIFNIAKTSVSKLRDIEQRSKRNSLLITKQTIYDIVKKLVDREPTDEELSTVYSNLRSIRNSKNKKLSSVKLQDGNLYFPGVTFDRISLILRDGFKNIVTDKKISEFFHRGHVYGLPTNIGYRTLENINLSGIPQELKEKLTLMLGKIIGELENQDLATSNIKDSEYYLYAKYAKRRNRYLVEMQIGSENTEAGRNAAPITNAIRRYFDPGNVAAIAKNLRERPQDAFIKQLIETHGSPSFKSLAIKSVVDTIKGTPLDNKTYTIPNTKVATAKVKFSNAEIKKDNAKEIAELKRLREKIKNSTVATKSIVGLESLLRTRLALQIRKNMGTGNAKNILNYRTGRFANTVTIDHITQSRAGMVSVFYDYMRYPYATFSEGGAQGYPKSRDPKLLISKSIREIGASLVSNRMRAVLV